MRVRRRPAVAHEAGDAGSGDRGDDAVRRDLADAVAEVGDEHVARRVEGLGHGLVERRADGRTAVAEIARDTGAREQLQRWCGHGGGGGHRAAEARQRDHREGGRRAAATRAKTANKSWRGSLADTGWRTPGRVAVFRAPRNQSLRDRRVARHAAGAGRVDRHVGAGARELELLLDDPRRLGLAQPDQALVVAVQAPEVPGVPGGARVDGTYPGPRRRRSRPARPGPARAAARRRRGASAASSPMARRRAARRRARSPGGGPRTPRRVAAR